MESAIAYGFYTVREVHSGQACAIFKSIAADCNKTVREIYSSQACATINDADERQTAQCRRVSARDIIGSAPKNGENTGFYSFFPDTARWHSIEFPLEAASAASVFCRIIDFISYIL